MSKVTGFTQIPNWLITTNLLTADAKLIYFHFLSKPKKFKIILTALPQLIGFNRDRCERACSLLRSFNFLESYRITDVNGLFISWEHIINRCPEIPTVGKDGQFLILDNPPNIINNISLKKERIKKASTPKDFAAMMKTATLLHSFHELTVKKFFLHSLASKSYKKWLTAEDVERNLCIWVADTRLLTLKAHKEKQAQKKFENYSFVIASLNRFFDDTIQNVNA